MQLSSSSVGARCFVPISRRASTAVRSQGSLIARRSICPSLDLSISKRQPVLAWLRSGNQATAVAIDPDRLPTAMRALDQFGIVTHARESVHQPLRNAALDLQLALQRQ